jgi:hypothetical protein
MQRFKILPLLSLTVVAFVSAIVQGEDYHNRTIQWGFDIHDDEISANKDDDLIFVYDPIHDVYLMPSFQAMEDCDFSGDAVQLCGFESSPCLVQLDNINSTQAYFACMPHCQLGLRMTVNLTSDSTEYEYE